MTPSADEITAQPAADIPPELQPLPQPLVWLMAGSCMIAVANVYYNQPLLSEFANYFHTSTQSAGVMATAAQVGYGVGLLFFIPLGDVLERRKVILCLSFACTALLVVGATSTSFKALVLSQFLIGTMAVNSQLLIPLAVEMSPPDRRGRTVGSLMAGLLTGLLLARTAAGIIEREEPQLQNGLVLGFGSHTSSAWWASREQCALPSPVGSPTARGRPSPWRSHSAYPSSPSSGCGSTARSSA
jgi:MFS family permease